MESMRRATFSESDRLRIAPMNEPSNRKHGKFPERRADYYSRKGNEMSTVGVHSATHLTGIAPQFLVDDLDRAIAYYCDQLGFELDFKYQSFYAAVKRDGFAIHLKHAPKLAVEREHRKQNEHLDAYISVSGIRGLFGELKMRRA